MAALALKAAAVAFVILCILSISDDRNRRP